MENDFNIDYNNTLSDIEAAKSRIVEIESQYQALHEEADILNAKIIDLEGQQKFIQKKLDGKSKK